MKVNVVANAHAQGGGEQSVQHILRMLIDDGNDVTFIPTKHLIPSFRIPPEVAVKPLADLKRDGADNCDSLMFYANDAVYGIPEHRGFWEKSMARARRVVVCLNFVLGPAAQPWFLNKIDHVLFLNATKEREFLTKTQFSRVTSSMAPPVDIAPYLAMDSPDYSDINFVRHGRHNRKFDPNITMALMSQFSGLFPRARFAFMASPPCIKKAAKSKFSNGLVDAYNWDDMPVRRFLQKGCVFWYPLPEAMHDQGPRVIVEAMAAGIPCIVDNRDGAKDRVTPETGWLCDTPADYVKAVQEIKDDPTVVAVKGVAARLRARDVFNPYQWVTAILGRQGQN